jgi:hypothetical protein
MSARAPHRSRPARTTRSVPPLTGEVRPRGLEPVRARQRGGPERGACCAASSRWRGRASTRCSRRRRASGCSPPARPSATAWDRSCSRRAGAGPAPPRPRRARAGARTLDHGGAPAPAPRPGLAPRRARGLLLDPAAPRRGRRGLRRLHPRGALHVAIPRGRSRVRPGRALRAPRGRAAAPRGPVRVARPRTRHGGGAGAGDPGLARVGPRAPRRVPAHPAAARAGRPTGAVGGSTASTSGRASSAAGRGRPPSDGWRGAWPAGRRTRLRCSEGPSALPPSSIGPRTTTDRDPRRTAVRVFERTLSATGRRRRRPASRASPCGSPARWP